MSKRRGVLVYRYVLEHIKYILGLVKLITPFSVLKNVVSDMSRMQFALPRKKQQARADFWKKECNAHPTSSACIIYD